MLRIYTTWNDKYRFRLLRDVQNEVPLSLILAISGPLCGQSPLLPYECETLLMNQGLDP